MKPLTIAGWVVGIILILTGLAWYTQPKNSPGLSAINNGLTALAAEHTFFDFGNISMANGNVNHSYKIKNETAEAINIAKMYTSCMCTTAYFIKDNNRIGPFGMPGHAAVLPLNKTLAPKEEATIEIVFDPTAHGPAGIGGISREIYLETKGKNLLTLGFSAQVTP